jgi:hypothetical protein
MIGKMDLHICEECGKEYKNAKSLWTHRKTYHKSTCNICTICKKEYKNNKSLWSHRKKYHQNACNFCDREFDKLCGLTTHLKTCQLNKDNIPPCESKTYEQFNGVSNSDIYKIIEQINNGRNNDKRDERHNERRDERRDERHNERNNKKLVQKVQQIQYNNSQLISNNNSNNNSNNIDNSIKVDNSIKIVSIGNENLSDVLNSQEQIRILNKRCQVLEEIIKYVHFNDKYPQFHNVIINDLKSGNALQFNEEHDDYIVVRKSEMLNAIIENRIDDISEFLVNNKQKLGKTTQKSITKFIDRVIDESDNPDSKYIKDKKKEIELLMYNNKNTIKKTQLKLKQKNV